MSFSIQVTHLKVERGSKYFTTRETRKWIDEKSVDDYNNSFHRTIRMTPVEASKPENSSLVWHNITEHI